VDQPGLHFPSNLRFADAPTDRRKLRLWKPPTALHFFAQFQTDFNLEGAKIVQETRISDYATFALNFLLVFGLAFELPVILVLLGCLGIISANFLRQTRRYAILLIGLFAAIATPPDALSMIFMGGALWILYEISIFLVSYFQKKPVEDLEKL